MRSWIVGGALALSACAGAAPAAAPQVAAAPQAEADEQAALQVIHDQHVICGDTQDCGRKWTEAVSWIAAHSGWKIETQSDNLVETFGPGDTIEPAFALVKSPYGQGYMIELRVQCGDLRCWEFSNLLKASFLLDANHAQPLLQTRFDLAVTERKISLDTPTQEQ